MLPKAFIAALISGCATIGPSDVRLPLGLLNNRASMFFTVGGKEYAGAATLQRKVGPGVSITFTLPKNTVLFQLDNCAREHVKIRPKGSTYTYYFNPSAFKESEDSCVMSAQATTAHGEIQTAIIDWTGHRRLAAKLWCNELQSASVTGVAFCQNRETKLMWIQFDEEVTWAAAEGCAEPVPARYHQEGTAYEIEIQKGLCAYGFISESRERLRLTTYGYSAIGEVVLGGEKAEM